jgi:hypothetical protein
VGDEGARELSVLDVVLDLETHVVTGKVLLKLGWLRRIELDLEEKIRKYFNRSNQLFWST